METNLVKQANQKKRLLLCWWYDRPDLMKPLIPLSEDFEIILLFYRFESQENKKTLPQGLDRIYWTNYRTPHELLACVKPECIIFMGVENLLSLGLLLAAKAQKIPTNYLAHGLKNGYNSAVSNELASVEKEANTRYDTKNKIYTEKKSHSLRFYLSSIRWNNLHALPYMGWFMYQAVKEKSIHQRLFKTRSEWRMPDQYLVISKAFSKLLVERDGVPESRLQEVGLYMYDELLYKLNAPEHHKANNSIWFFIDQPIHKVSPEQKGIIVEKLRKAAALSGCTLHLKLHPMDYGSRTAYHPDVVIHEHVDDIAALINQTSICISFSSALIMPVIPFKKCIIIDIGAYEFVKDIGRLNAIILLTITQLMTESERWLSEQTDQPLNPERYIQKYIKYADHRGLDRVIQALKEQHA